MCGLQLDEPLKTRYKMIKFSNPAELKLIEFDELELRTEGEGFNFSNLFLQLSRVSAWYIYKNIIWNSIICRKQMAKTIKREVEQM